MHYIYGGKNVDILLKDKEKQFNIIYVNSFNSLVTTCSLSMYKSIYKEDSKPVMDITDKMLNKALTIIEIPNDFKLALKSLIKETV